MGEIRSGSRVQVSRELAKALGLEIVEILKSGRYVAVSGKQVEVHTKVHDAVRKTVSYPPEDDVPAITQRPGPTLVEVKNETTLASARYLISKGFKPAALNFASAVSPGGGFLSGARAQEEYLSRSSALYACIRHNEMYSYHRVRKDPFYSDYVIYSPDVPILRNDDGELLDEPYLCSIITSPAVNASAVLKYARNRLEEIGAAMRNRIIKVLAVAQIHGHNALVLGAWGCGAFGNDGHLVAQLFRKSLQVDFCGTFEHVVFAITDRSSDRRFIGPFNRAFDGGKILFHRTS
jgi:uncharacterized protein (TIGR02452 family)